MSIEVGTILEGKVTGITHFGAFVDIGGGVTGLVHISEVADTYVKDIKDYLKENDIVRVKVINVRDGKIGLSIRQADPNSSGPRRAGRPAKGRAPKSFEDKLARFLRESEERQSALRKSTDGKRGGRGARSY